MDKYILDISGVCRSCLKADTNMHYLFDDDCNNLFENCTGITVSEEDNLPKYICMKCLDELQIAHGFKTRSIQANASFIEHLKSKAEDHSINQTTDDFEDQDFKIEIISPQISNKEDIHNISNESKEKRICYICNEELPKASEMILHRAKHFFYKCRNCKIGYKTKEEAKNHACTKGLSDIGTINIQRLLKCHICDRELMYSRSLRHHLRTHSGEKPCLCTMCGLKFREEKALVNHIKAVHTKEKNFKCAFCPKGFSVSGKRREHERTHTGEKPHECCHCTRLFATRCALTAHMRTHSKQLVYKCTIQDCHKGFYSFSSYQRHTWAHRGERPYECGRCQKTYLSKQNLMAHQKSVHSQLKDQICHMCNKQFSETSTLNRHLRTIHKTEPLKSKKPIAVYANSIDQK